MIEHLIVAHPDAASWVPYAQNFARKFYRNLEASRRKIGSKQQALDDNDHKVYIQVRVVAPNVWIYLDIGRCPIFSSGLVWVKDPFEPNVTVDEVEKLSTLFPKSTPAVEVDAPQLASNSDQFLGLRPTMFSGEMRKVVQVLMGSDVEIPYNYRGTETHGVYVSTSDSRWIIKINDAGMVAYPMSVCHGKNSPASLGYTPLVTAEPEEPIELLSAAAVAHLYTGKTAFFSACGWAFSETGRKLANCLLGYEAGACYSYLYEITITEDDQRNPVAASISLVNEGYIHGPKTTHMKYPDADNFKLFSFDPYGGNANYDEVSNGPVFCFYDGESLQKFFYTYQPGSINHSGPTPPGGVLDYCLEYQGYTWIYNGPDSIGMPGITRNEVSYKRKFTDSSIHYGWHDVGSIGICYEPVVPSSADAYRDLHEIHTDRYTHTSVVRGDTKDVLVVPAKEREVAYIASSRGDDSGGVAFRQNISYWHYLIFDWEETENCDAAGGVRPTEVLLTGIRELGFITPSCQTGLAAVGEACVGSRRIYNGGVGSTVRVAYYSDFLCQAVSGPQAAEDQIDIAGASKVRVTTYELTAYGSGGTAVSFDSEPADMALWLQFIEWYSDQTVFVLRDAFDPDRAAYTARVNDIAGQYLDVQPGFAPYVLDDVYNAVLAFVGVP